MAVTININDETTERELAAIACLIAVLRSDQPIPAPPQIIFDHSDMSSVVKYELAPQDDPIKQAFPTAPPPPSEPPASEVLIQQEADRAYAATVGELDSNGIPWDERIHAGTKVKNNDGSWRNKRGVDAGLVTQVTAELKGHAESLADPVPIAEPIAAGALAPDAPPPPTEPGPAAVADAATAFGAAGVDGASEAPPPPGTAPPPPATPAADAPAAGTFTYPQILTRANEAGLDYDTLNAMSVDMGLEKFASLAKAPATTLRLFADTMEAKILELAGAPAA